jgi:hypothetical protein
LTGKHYDENMIVAGVNKVPADIKRNLSASLPNLISRAAAAPLKRHASLSSGYSSYSTYPPAPVAKHHTSSNNLQDSGIVSTGLTNTSLANSSGPIRDQVKITVLDRNVTANTTPIKPSVGAIVDLVHNYYLQYSLDPGEVGAKKTRQNS